MTPAEKLKAQLRQITKPADVTLDGTVTLVDEDNYTCNVILPNDVELFDVQLHALKGQSDCVVIVPTVDSTVQVINIGTPDWLVISCDKVDKVIVRAATKVELTCDDLEINGGDHEGLVIAGKLVERLNKVEQALADLIQKYNAHTHPYLDNGTPTATSVTTSQSNKQVTNTHKADIENPKVKH